MWPTVITHADADGIISLSLFFQHIWSFKCNVYFSSAFRLKDTILMSIKRKFLNELYVFDLSASEQTLILSSFYKKIIWIDHHLWPELKIPKNVETFVDPKALSAAQLVGKYFKVDSELIEIANEIDKNVTQSEEAEFLRNLIAATKWKYPTDFNKLKTIAKNLAISGIRKFEENKNIAEMISNYSEWIRNFKKEVFDKIKVFELENLKIAIYESSKSVPVYVINDELQKHEKAPFDIIAVIIRKDLEEGIISKVELRTHTDKDVYKIAKNFGGGGHKVASAFSLNATLNTEELIKIIEKSS